MTLQRILLVFLAVVVVFCFAGTVLASGGHGPGPADSGPLSPDPFKKNLALWSFVIFVALFAVLYKFAFAPIAKGLDAREEGIANQIASAERANVDAKQLLAQYQQKIDAAGDEVKQIIDNAKQEGRRMADDIVAKAHESAAAQQKRALAEIDAATTNALQDLAEQSATLATNLAGRIIRKEIDPNAHRDLVSAAINNLNNN